MDNKVEKLKKYIKQIRGISFRPNEIITEKQPGYYPILKANNITEDGLDDEDLIFIKRDKINDDQFIKKGDILIAASSGSKKVIGKNVCFDKDYNGSFGAFCKVIRPINNIHYGYLKHFFKTPYYFNTIQNSVQGANINNLKTRDLDDLDFFIPKRLEDQIHIANILSRAEGLIAKRKESIQLLGELLKSTFLDMFGDPIRNEKGWAKKKLKDVCNRITDGTHFSPPIKEAGIPYITAKHVRENKIDFFGNPWYISEHDHKEIYKRCDPQKGDVLYIKDGATTGYAAINKYEFEFSMLSSLALLKTNKSICNAEYLCSWLNNPVVKSRILLGMSGGAIQRLTLTKINELPINLPPIELQIQFAQIVEKVESIKTKYQESLQELENLYASLSQKAFKGELDLSKMEIKDYNLGHDEPGRSMAAEGKAGYKNNNIK